MVQIKQTVEITTFDDTLHQAGANEANQILKTMDNSRPNNVPDIVSCLIIIQDNINKVIW